MVRLARFNPDAFVAAATALVAEAGPSAATMAAIARRVGAPMGSLYHRFESRAAVLATAWIEAHSAFLARIEGPLRAGHGLDAALAIPAWARDDFTRSRFLLLNDADTLFDDPPPPELRRDIRRQEDRLDDAFRAYLPTLDGANRMSSAEIAARGKFLIFDGPIALLRPHLEAGGPIPDFVDAAVAELHQAMTGAVKRRKRPTQAA